MKNRYRGPRTYALVVLVLLAGLAPAHLVHAQSDGVDGTTYTSPTYGYVLTWTDDWSVDAVDTDGINDSLSLSNDIASLQFSGTAGQADPDAASCLAETVEVVTSTAEYDPEEYSSSALDGNDDPLLQWAILAIDWSGGDGSLSTELLYLECARLPETEVDLVTVFRAPETDFNGLLDAAIAIRDSVNGGSVEVSASAEVEADNLAIADFWDKNIGVLAPGETYDIPAIELYSGTVQTACDSANDEEDGSFYCPPERKIYMSESMTSSDIRRFGESSRRLTVAHESGHHVQELLDGESINDCRTQKPCDDGFTGMQMELMADCFSGAWFAWAQAQGDYTEVDVYDSVAVQWSVGDPYGANPMDEDAHGSSAMRAYWFTAGYFDGVGICLTTNTVDPESAR